MPYIYKITNKINNKVYIGKTITAATNFLNKNQKAGSAISQVCKGNRKTAYGYSWKYEN